MNRRTAAAVIAIVLTVLGVVSLVVYVNDAEDRAFEGTELTDALQVVDPVPAGTPADQIGPRVEAVRLPKAAVPSDALTDVDSVGVQQTTSNLEPGEILLQSKFSEPDEIRPDGSIEVPDGLQEITIALDFQRALGGVLEAGDTVGIVASYDDPDASNFLQNRVLVVSVGPEGQGAEGSVGATIVLRLAVASDDAVKIAHAAEFGHVWLTRQGEESDVDRRLITREGVLRD